MKYDFDINKIEDFRQYDRENSIKFNLFDFFIIVSSASQVRSLPKEWKHIRFPLFATP